MNTTGLFGHGGRLALRATLLGAFAGAIALGGCGDDIAATPDARPPIDAKALTPAVLSISPGTNDFGSVDLNTNSASATFTITNSGEDVSGSIVPVITGANASDFTLQNGCTTLAGAGTCSVTVTFHPSTIGAKNASLVVSGSPGGSVMSALLGAGQTPGTLSISSALTFPQTSVGQTSAAQTFTVTNTGTTATTALTVSKAGSTPGEFTIGTNTCASATLAGGATCTFSVTFAPTSAGDKSASFVVAATTGGTVTGSASGTAVSAATLTLTPLFQDYGTVTINTNSSVSTFTLTNSGGTTSGLVAAPAITGADATQFTINSTNCTNTTLAPGGSCQIAVRFTPTTAGTKNATLSLTSAGGGSPSAALTGVGANTGNITINNSPASFTATVGTPSASQTFTITNTGGSTTGALSTALGGSAPDQFQVIPGGNGCQGTTLGASQSCTIAVRFNPSSGGSKSATLSVTAVPGGAATAVLNGTANAAAALALTPTSLDFGSVITNDSSSFQAFTLTNTGGQTSAVPAVTIGGANATQFNLASPNPCPMALAAGTSCTINVRFSPTAVGQALATLDVVAGSLTASSALSGNGVAQAALAVNPTIIQFPLTLTGDNSAVQSFQVTNNGSQTTGTLSITSTSGDFTQTNNCTTLIANASCTVTVTFSPTARGSRAGTIQVAGTPGGTVGVAVRGDSLPRIELISPPTPYAFADAVVHPVNPNSQVVTIRNNTAATQDLVVTETDLSTSFPVASNCIDPVFAGATCTFSVAFDPSAVGALSASFNIHIVGSASPLDAATLAVSGNGTVTTLAISDGDTTPTSHAFGTQAINTSSAAHRFTVSNTGTSTTGVLAIDLGGTGFQVDQNTCSGATLAAGQTCFVDVVFTPTAVASSSGSLTVRASQGAPVLGGSVTATFTGVGTAATPLANPTSIAFGTLFAGDTATANTDRTIVVTNPNDVSTGLTYALTNDPQGGFSRLTGAAGDCGASLAAGAQCNVRIRFTPALPTGPRSGSFKVSQTVSGQSATVALTGTVASAFSFVAAPTSFGNVVVGQSATQTVMIRNDTTNQTINSFMVDAGGAPYFVLNNTCTSLAPGATCSFTLQFSPTAAGTFPRLLRVDGGTTGSVTASISGTGITVASVTVTPASTQSFGSEFVGQPGSSRTFTYTNVGQQTSGAPAITVTGDTADFTVTANTCTAALAANATCTVTVRFNPTAAGNRAATITSTTTPGGTSSVTLNGVGIAPGGVRVTPGIATFPNTTTGQNSASQTFTVTNTSTTSAATLAINDGSSSFEVLTGAGTTCAINGALAPGQSCTIAVRFTPQSAGPLTATLQISGPTVATLEGRGLTVANVTTNAGGTFSSAPLTVTGQNFTPITVSGITGNVDTLTLRIVNLSGAAPSGYVFLLADPNGHYFEFDSGACGNTPIANVNLQFQDDATTRLPATTCVSGTYLPANYRAAFGGPPIDRAPPAGTGTFAGTFRGRPANGQWGIYSYSFNSVGTVAGFQLDINNGQNFGTQAVNTTSAIRTITFTNSGETTAAPLVGTQSGANSDNFVVNNGCQNVALAPGASCDVTIAFRPLTTGVKDTRLDFTGPGVYSIQAAGTGVNPGSLSITPSVQLNDGSRAIGATDTAATVYTVANAVGSATTSPIAFTLSNTANFTFSSANSTCNLTGTQTLAPGTSCTVGVFFNPTQLGSQTTSVVVSATNGGTVAGSLSGTGNEALVAVTPTPVALGSVAVGSASGVTTVTFRNDADSPTSLIQTTLSNSAGMDFSIVSDNCGGASLAANSQCDIQVRFVPSGAAGTRSANLSVSAQIGTVTTTAAVQLQGTAN